MMRVVFSGDGSHAILTTAGVVISAEVRFLDVVTLSIVCIPYSVVTLSVERGETFDIEEMAGTQLSIVIILLNYPMG